MTSAHFIYIPLVAIAGLMLGFILGARAARNAYDLEMVREKERVKVRAERAARKAARAAKAANESDQQAGPHDGDS